MELTDKEKQSIRTLNYIDFETLMQAEEYILFLEERIEALTIPVVSNFVLLAKPNYKAKDGTIKRGIEIDGKYYAPQNDC